MGAHGTLQEALDSVAAFTSAEEEQHLKVSRQDLKKKKASSKKPKRKDKKDEKEAAKKASKSSKGRSGKKKAHASSSCSDSGSDVGGNFTKSSTLLGGVQKELARAQQATRCARELLFRYPSSRKDLRQLLWTIDQGQALDVSGIADAEMRTGVTELLSQLPTQRTAKQVFLKAPGATSIMGQLAFVFDESTAQLAAAAAKAVAQTRIASGRDGRPASTSLSKDDAHSSASPVGDSGPGSEDRESQSERASLPTTAAAYEVDNSSDAQAAETAGASVNEPAAAQHPPEDMPRQRGPAMPSAELLAAAQDAALEMARAEADAAAEEAALELIGPPPPEIIAEADSEGMDLRTAEVKRICGVLAATQAFLALGSNPALPDAYQVLGLPHDVTSADVRKRYFKLSLTVHPDKCEHPRAKDAFHAVDLATKLLRDENQRKQLDAALEHCQLQKDAAAHMEDLERERQWRIAKGTATEEDRMGPVSREPEGRGTWMTELPVSRRPAQPQQVNVTSFNKTGPVKAVDSREWTETPTQKLMRISAAASAGPAAIGAPGDDAAARKCAETANAIDAYNSGVRRKTLMQVHADKQAAERKAERKAKKRKKGDSTDTGINDPAGDWQSNAPWRPFDRERDLQTGAAPATPKEMLKKAGSLSTRFGGGNTGRSFL